jgi:predicted AlkP superfamily phosphohydrolase/phosphomutase
MMVLDSEGKNYSNWASRMQSVFKVYHIWDVVEDESKGSAVMPTAQGQPLTDWLERDEKAFTYIKCYVSDPCMSMIRDEQHA